MKIAAFLLKLPIHFYRWTIRPWTGWQCRHLPTCSEYALESIDKNGAWKGFWLTTSRLLRCHPWGTHGYDPAPDLSCDHHPFAPWRYGRWTGRHMRQKRHGEPKLEETAQDARPSESSGGS